MYQIADKIKYKINSLLSIERYPIEEGTTAERQHETRSLQTKMLHAGLF